MKTLRVAVAGAGYFCQFQLDGWRRIAGIELAGICNRDTAKAEALAKRFSVPRVFGGIAEMLDGCSPDIVDIVTPPVTHREYVGEAARRRMTAICQKPFGRSHAEAVQIAAMARDAGIVLAVHENFRFMPHFREMKRLLEAGQLGAVHSIAFRLRPGDGQGADAYLARQGYFQKMPRFLVFETAIHLIDTFRYLVGEVRSVTACLRRINPAISGEDAGYIVFEFAGGTRDALQAHVVRHLREGTPLENSAADYLANMTIMEAVYASSEQGRRIEIAGYTSS